MKINERIKKRRKALNLTADYIAEKLGISRASYYRYENKEVYNMPITAIEPLAQVLNVTPAYIMGWESAPVLEKLTPLEKQHLDKYRGLTTAGKSAIDAQMDFMLYQQDLDVKKDGLRSAS